MSHDIDEDFDSDDCTCRYIGLGGNDPDGHYRRDRWCPIHGDDPDSARERQQDRRDSDV